MSQAQYLADELQGEAKAFAQKALNKRMPFPADVKILALLIDEIVDLRKRIDGLEEHKGDTNG